MYSVCYVVRSASQQEIGFLLIGMNWLGNDRAPLTQRKQATRIIDCSVSRYFEPVIQLLQSVFFQCILNVFHCVKNSCRRSVKCHSSSQTWISGKIFGLKLKKSDVGYDAEEPNLPSKWEQLCDILKPNYKTKRFFFWQNDLLGAI
jgi:hypothetical protein